MHVLAMEHVFVTDKARFHVRELIWRFSLS